MLKNVRVIKGNKFVLKIFRNCLFNYQKKLGIRNCVGRSTGSMVGYYSGRPPPTYNPTLAPAAVRHRRPIAT